MGLLLKLSALAADAVFAVALAIVICHLEKP